MSQAESRPAVSWGRKIRLRFLLVSVVLYLVSLVCDCVYVGAGSESIGPGWSLLLVGCIASFQGDDAWWANLTLFLAWLLILLRSRLVSLVLAVASIALALSFLRVDDLLINEGGGREKIVGYGIGYWLWIASMSVAAAGCVLGLILDVIAARARSRLASSGTSPV